MVIYACLAVSGVLLTSMYRRSHGKSVLFYLGAFFALFAYGPVINHLLGRPIYFGIDTRYIDEAGIGFTIAIAGLASADLMKKQVVKFPAEVDSDPYRLYQFYSPLLVLLVAYGAVMTGRLLPEFSTGNKLGQIALAGPGHRIYLVLELCAVSTYFITRRSGLLRRLWFANAITYVAYCLATSERDFLFVLFSILLHRQILGRCRGLILAGIGSTIVASFLFATRNGKSLDITGVLNQGSLLFVDSFVLGQTPVHIDYAYGATYWQTLRTLPPDWIYDSGAVPLSSWLVNHYAPGSDGGYGFSLSAEAYMNFGPVGIFGVFLLLGLALRMVINQFGQSEWYSYFSVYFTAASLYALRGDSSQLAKLVIYGAIFFAVIHVTSTPATSASTGRANAVFSIRSRQGRPGPARPDRDQTARRQTLSKTTGLRGTSSADCP
jgi:hypothetical protein